MAIQYSVIKTNKDVVAVLNVPKCGSQTLRFHSQQEISELDACKYRRIAFVREPIDRLQSYYFFALKTGYKPEDMPIGWEAYIDWVLDEANDEHVIPQSEYLYGVQNRFDEIYLLSDMDKVLGYKSDRQHVVSREREVDTNYRMKDINDYYIKDSEIIKEYGLYT